MGKILANAAFIKIIKSLLIFVFVAVVILNYNLTGKEFTTGVLQHHSPPTAVIEQGSGVEAASYIIFRDNDSPVNYYAKNASTGAIEFKSTNASYVIQSAINTLTSGGKIFIRTGTYAISSTITINQNFITISGEGSQATILQGGAGNIDVLNLSMPTSLTELDGVVIRDISISGASLTDSGNLITSASIAGTYSTVTRLTLSGLRILNIAGGKAGVYLVNPTNVLIENSMFTSFGSNSTGVYMVGNGYPSGHIYLIGDYFHVAGSAKNATAVHFASTTAANSMMRRVSVLASSFDLAGSAANATGILLDGTSSQGYRFFDNTFEEFYKTFSIQPSSGYIIRDVRIRDNMIWYRTNPVEANQLMIYLGTRTASSEVIGNYLEGVSGSGAKGIQDDAAAEPHNKIEQNEFRFMDTKIIRNAYTRIRGNIGYITENTNTTAVANNDYIAHGLATTPTNVLLTPTVYNMTAYLMSKNSTHFQVGLYYTTTGTNVTTATNVTWYAEV